jgi:glutaryl-CoA dehydrogenase (non-decarboxylating)
MIDFELNEDHKALMQTVREFAQKEVAPYIKEWDEKQEFQPSVLKKMGELNLLGVCIPEEYGGAGFDYISLGLVCEELEAVDTFLRVVMSVHTGTQFVNSLFLGHGGAEAKVSGAAGKR